MEEKAKTPDEVREELRNVALIRVDGLKADWRDERGTYIIGEPSSAHLWQAGHYGSNNSYVVAVTAEQEIWLGAHSKEFFELVQHLRLEPGCNVPCSNWEEIATIDLLRRCADPDYVPEYA